MGAGKADDFVADCRHQGHGDDAGQYAPVEFGSQNGVQDGEGRYGYDGDGNQKGGAAAGVRRGMLAHVVHRERLAGFVGVHRHVLGAVIGVHPADVLHQRDAGHVAHQDDQPDDALNQVDSQQGVYEGFQQAGSQQRQHQEDADAQHQGDGHGDAHGPVVDGGTGRSRIRVTLTPTLSRQGRGRRLLFGGDDGGALEGLHAQPEGFGQYQHAAEEGHAPHPAGEPGADGLGRAEDAAVGSADGEAVMADAANHHALDDGLAAVERARRFRGGCRVTATH